MKKIALMALSLLLTSACSLGGLQKIEVLDNIKPSEVRIATNNEFKSLQSRGSVKSDEQLYVANLGKKDGAQFLVKFDFNSFKTKASVNGVPEKVASDVASVDIYLFRLPSNYNPSTVSGKNPFGVSNENLYWSKTGVTKNGSAINLLFTGVPGSTKHYYAGVVAKDINGNVISKDGYKWTGETDGYEGFNISSSGVGVNETSLEVSTTDPLNIGVSLLDAVGAKIDTTVNLTSGSSALPSVAGSVYKLESKIAFANYNSSNNTGNLSTMNINGANKINSLEIPSGSFFIGSTSLSPDKSKILFSIFGPGGLDLYIANTDGSGTPTNITNSPDIIENYASWSPDGSKILYSAVTDDSGFPNNPHAEIYTMDADGSNINQIVGTPFANFTPSWSPDGSKIAYASNEDGDFEIYITNSDGSGTPTQLTTNNGVYDFSPVWSPDGSKIAYSSDFVNLYSINSSDGSEQNLVLDSSPLAAIPTHWKSNKLVLTSFDHNNSGNFFENAFISTVETDGSNFTQISDTSVGNSSFTSTPLGVLIYYYENNQP